MILLFPRFARTFWAIFCEVHAFTVETFWESFFLCPFQAVALPDRFISILLFFFSLPLKGCLREDPAFTLLFFDQGTFDLSRSANLKTPQQTTKIGKVDFRVVFSQLISFVD